MTSKTESNVLKFQYFWQVWCPNVPQEAGFQGSQARLFSPQSVQSSNAGLTLIIGPQPLEKRKPYDWMKFWPYVPRLGGAARPCSKEARFFEGASIEAIRE